MTARFLRHVVALFNDAPDNYKDRIIFQPEMQFRYALPESESATLSLCLRSGSAQRGGGARAGQPVC